jgi:hypothetical protein
LRRTIIEVNLKILFNKKIVPFDSLSISQAGAQDDKKSEILTHIIKPKQEQNGTENTA